MTRLHHVVIGRQHQIVVAQALDLGLALVKKSQVHWHIGMFKIVGAELHFVLVMDLAVRDVATVWAPRPHEVVDAFDTLQIHAQAFQTIRNFSADHGQIETAALLKIGKLRHFHAVEPDFPA